MLMRMGWSEGKGLGKELQGAATHVTVSKKTDSAGLGAVKDDTGNLGWTEASATFDSVLSRLNARYGNDGEAAKKAEKKRRKKEKVRAGGLLQGKKGGWGGHV
jgi:Pin2-interacting protein X1